MAETERRRARWSLDQEAAERLAEQGIIRDLDRTGHPHFAVKVPDLSQALESDLGMEVDQEEDRCVVLSVLLYDIPTEPVSYDMRFYPDRQDDLRFLRGVMDAAGFRLCPCQQTGNQWVVGPSLTFRLPANVLLRLKHLSLDWPQPAVPPAGTEPPAQQAAAAETAEPLPEKRSGDPRDTVIRKLKEQVRALRTQVQDRDKRIIELEDELHEIRSRGRGYKLTGDKRSWWKPF